MKRLLVIIGIPLVISICSFLVVQGIQESRAKKHSIIIHDDWTLNPTFSRKGQTVYFSEQKESQISKHLIDNGFTKSNSANYMRQENYWPYSIFEDLIIDKVSDIGFLITVRYWTFSNIPLEDHESGTFF